MEIEYPKNGMDSKIQWLANEGALCFSHGVLAGLTWRRLVPMSKNK